MTEVDTETGISGGRVVDFELSDELRKFRDSAASSRRPSSRRTRPSGTAEARFPREAIQKAAKRGFLGVTSPEGLRRSRASATSRAA